MKETFYLIEQEFSNGLENGFRVSSYDFLNDAFMERDKRMSEVGDLWKDVPHDMIGDDKSLIIVRDGFCGEAYKWTVVSSDRAMKAVIDAVDERGKVGTLEHITADGNHEGIGVTELELPADALPWTNMYSDRLEVDGDGITPVYKPFKVVMRPYDLDDLTDEGKVFDIYMTMMTGDGNELTYVESLENVGDLVLSNIFVHL